MNRWKYLALLVVILLGSLYALPNLFGEEPAVQIAATGDALVDSSMLETVKNTLTAAGITYHDIQLDNRNIVVRFDSINTQIRARDLLQSTLNSHQSAQEKEPYTVALNLMNAAPSWLQSIGAKPMKLGLDLRGGVHFLLEIDTASVVERHLQGSMRSILKELRDQTIRYSSVHLVNRNAIAIQFDDATQMQQAKSLIQQKFSDLLLHELHQQKQLNLELTPAALNEIRQYTIEQTMTTLRNRVNELGVAEAVVQQQGTQRVAVDLPGIQDASHAKQILGGTATLAFYLVDVEHDARTAQATGAVPLGSRVYSFEDQPILLKNQVVLSGDAIVSARTGFDENGSPAVHVMISGSSEAMFTKTTRENIGKPLAIVFIETKTESRQENGQVVKTHRKIERIISAPRIQSALSNNFQITGLNEKEAKDLALLLRAGSLPASIEIVEERTVGPSLGAENIHRGLVSLAVGMSLVVVFMAIYYQGFGIIADLALFVNLILLVAALSLLDATLTLPGIAGIVLTVGMAVDSNVLIFERIREELRLGSSPHTSIRAGYERAFATIVDANVTTLIVAIVLFSIGTGAVRGFAVTLTIGLLTSMITAITFTRGIVDLVYGRKARLKRLSIGI